MVTAPHIASPGPAAEPCYVYTGGSSVAWVSWLAWRSMQAPHRVAAPKSLRWPEIASVWRRPMWRARHGCGARASRFRATLWSLNLMGHWYIRARAGSPPGLGDRRLEGSAGFARCGPANHPAVPYCTPGMRGNLRPPRSRSRGGMDDAAHRRL